MDSPGETKIAYFLDIPKGLGGAGNLLLQQASLMAGLYDVIVVIPVDGEGNCNDEYVRRCKINNLPYIGIQYETAHNFYLIDFTGGVNSADDIELFAKRERITFFHSVQLNLAAEYVSRKLGIPHLMNIYQLKEEEFKICPGDIYSHYHLCDSLLYAERWSRQLGIKSKCIRPVAIRDSVKRKNTYLGHDIAILMLGGLYVYKNQMAAIKAIEQCIANDYEITLHIAGRGETDYAEECKLYVREHGLEHNVVFHGFVSNIIPLLENSDCLLCASYNESFPMSVVEALTYGLTIISTPVAGIPEVFKDKENSFISMDFSEKSIGKSIENCLDYYKNGRIDKIHQNAEETWNTNFKRDHVRSQIDLYYKDIISDKSFKDIQPFLEMEEDVKQTESLLRDFDRMGEEWIDKRLLYYTFIRKNFTEGKIYIWGAGKIGKLAFGILKKLCPDMEIAAFIDTYKEGNCCGIPVIRPENILPQEGNFYCVSFAKGSDRAIEYLENKGMVLNRQIWKMP